MSKHERQQRSAEAREEQRLLAAQEARRNAEAGTALAAVRGESAVDSLEELVSEEALAGMFEMLPRAPAAPKTAPAPPPPPPVTKPAPPPASSRPMTRTELEGLLRAQFEAGKAAEREAATAVVAEVVAEAVPARIRAALAELVAEDDAARKARRAARWRTFADRGVILFAAATAFLCLGLYGMKAKQDRLYDRIDATERIVRDLAPLAPKAASDKAMDRLAELLGK